VAPTPISMAEGSGEGVLEVELSKQQQSSDWGAESSTEQQLAYAANDVAFLHRLKMCWIRC